MIKASELRIGNLVLIDAPDGSFQKWKKIPHSIVHYDLSEDELPFQGTPLTEEWLIKLGATRGYDEYVYDLGLLRLEYIIWADSDPEWKPSRINGERLQYWRHGMKAVKYVHQLQNLYHALTGEELTIKEI